MNKYLLIVLGLFILTGCGESYSVPRATFHIDLKNAEDAKILAQQINEFLLSEGFADLGIYEEMINLLSHSGAREEYNMKEIYDDQIQRIRLERNYVNKSRKIDVQITDYSDPDLKKRYVNYPTSESAITGLPSLEVNIHNMRPGGFSADALKFYDKFTSLINSKYGGDIKIIFSPPKSDQKEFYRISTKNLLGRTFNWIVVFVLTIAIFGLIIIKLLKLTKLNIFQKRAIFSICGSILSTPLPFPVATILTTLLPSVFAIPAIGSDYFSRIADVGIKSFLICFSLCVLLSVILIKEKKTAGE